MTTNHHTPIANGAAANSATVNDALSELDTALTDHETRIGDLENDMPVLSGNPTEYLDGEGNFTVPAGTGASVDGHLIKEEGSALPQRAVIDFVGAGVTVTNEAGGTQVSIPGGSADSLAKTGLTEWDEQGSDPSTPASTKWKVYFKSGGLYVIDDAGTVIGPIDVRNYLAKTGLTEWDEQGSDPSTPASGKWKLYFKAGGIYLIDDTGAVIGPLVGTTNVVTLSGKRNTKRLVTVTAGATPSINTDDGDIFTITGLAADITSLTSNLTGTPNDGDMMLMRITDNGTSRAITPGASFIGTSNNSLSGITTTINKILILLWQWNATLSKWVLLGKDSVL